MPTEKVIYGHYCPLCGKPAVVDGKCQACLYVIGSDPDIDGSPVPHGGYSDEVLVRAKEERKAQIGGVLFGLGLLLIVVGLIVYANGGTWVIFAVGLAMWIYRFCSVMLFTARTTNKAWRNRTMYWAYGERPDWDKRRR